MIRVADDVRPESGLKLRWAGHLEVVDIDDEVSAALGVPVARAPSWDGRPALGLEY